MNPFWLICFRWVETTNQIFFNLVETKYLPSAISQPFPKFTLSVKIWHMFRANDYWVWNGIPSEWFEWWSWRRKIKKKQWTTLYPSYPEKNTLLGARLLIISATKPLQPEIGMLGLGKGQEVQDGEVCGTSSFSIHNRDHKSVPIKNNQFINHPPTHLKLLITGQPAGHVVKPKVPGFLACGVRCYKYWLVIADCSNPTPIVLLH